MMQTPTPLEGFEEFRRVACAKEHQTHRGAGQKTGERVLYHLEVVLPAEVWTL